MRVIITILLLVCMFCQKEDCKTGKISIGSLSKTYSKSTESALLDLPSDFHYSSVDIKRAIVGAWLNSNSDSAMIVKMGQDSRIDFNIAGEDQKCGPTLTRTFFNCTSNKTPGISFSGSITFYNFIDSGEVEMDISNKPYIMKYFLNKTDSSHKMISFTGIPELDLSKGDSLKMTQ